MNKTTTKKKLLGCLLALLLMAFVLVTMIWTRGPSLSSIKHSISQDYSNVKQMSAEPLSQLKSSDLLLFDVREQEEFAISHLSNAVHIEPSITPTEFEQRYGALLANKTVVFYCSVGRRSSDLASKLEDVLQDNHAGEFYNLSGGIFEWRNEGRPLVNLDQEATEKVHPFNAFWGRLVNDKSAIVN